MHILMIAPEPFFEPRGTPFSEYHRLRALSSMGHTVDFVTYPFGEDRDIPGVRIIRTVKPPFISRVKIGPSWAKVPLDICLAFTSLRVGLGGRYDAVHSHEEGGAIGVVLSWLLGVPHLYDMHSSLPQQISNFGHANQRWMAKVFDWLERIMLRRSKVVIVICPQLEEVVRQVNTTVPVVLIENAMGSGDAPTPGSGAAVRSALGLGPDTPMVLYTGTFEAYQGLDLLFGAMPEVIAKRPDVKFVLMGGDADQVRAAESQVAALGIAKNVLLTGQRPVGDVPAYLDAADALVSPRSLGTNTPLKIYQYLRSGRPIVATRLLTHTQVLDDDTSILTAPEPAAYAAGILAAISDRARAREIGARAKAMADVKYSEQAYLAKTRDAMAILSGSGA
ncbi:MAG: glycosyltransferase [Acidobacteria bacterium]|nr:MAG: glycosyltransferase [Acidobacteriota bacterium]